MFDFMLRLCPFITGYQAQDILKYKSVSLFFPVRQVAPVVLVPCARLSLVSLMLDHRPHDPRRHSLLTFWMTPPSLLQNPLGYSAVYGLVILFLAIL